VVFQRCNIELENIPEEHQEEQDTSTEEGGQEETASEETAEGDGRSGHRAAHGGGRDRAGLCSRRTGRTDGGGRSQSGEGEVDGRRVERHDSGGHRSGHESGVVDAG